MPKLFDVVKGAGTYTDKNGQTKTRWIKCGVIIKNQNGNVAMKLDSLPLGTAVEEDGGIWFALFTPEDQGQQNQPVQQQPVQNAYQNSGQPKQAFSNPSQAQQAPPDDDIPW